LKRTYNESNSRYTMNFSQGKLSKTSILDDHAEPGRNQHHAAVGRVLPEGLLFGECVVVNCAAEDRHPAHHQTTSLEFKKHLLVFIHSQGIPSEREQRLLTKFKGYLNRQMTERMQRMRDTYVILESF
jgi:hypothetical protein